MASLTEHSAWRRAASLGRGLALTCIVALGLVAILGSGGGGGDNCLSNLEPCIKASLGQAFPGVNQVHVYPERGTAQVGAEMVFTANASGPGGLGYQWRRSSDGGRSYADIAGATGATYRLSNPTLADDGSLFLVEVRGGGVAAASSNAALLLVSSMPGVVFEDGDFQTVDWQVDAIAVPAQNGPTHSEERADTGGLPAAFRKMLHTMTAAPSSLRVFHLRQRAWYDPAAEGPIHAIDYSEDCSVLDATLPTMTVASYLLIEQNGRRFVSNIVRDCLPLWIRPLNGPSLDATNFAFVDGPACAAGEPCPDFSAGAKPIRFGFERRVQQLPGVTGVASIEHGIDNWKVTVWRP